MDEYSQLTQSDLPASLATLRPSVKALYVRGQWRTALFQHTVVAIIGSRRMTSYGQRAIEKIVPSLTMAGVTIVSGFMYGVDQTAHQTCIEAGGKTIAVLPWGIERKVASEDQPLMQQILEHDGLILSEYPKITAAKPWMFVQRNRIVSGLCEAVVVIEAALGSGSLTTAQWAIKQGKLLFAVPGPITSPTSEGTNQLIASGKARLLQSADQILQAIRVAPCTQGATIEDRPQRGRSSPQTADPLFTILSTEPLTPDELSIKTRIPVEQIITKLSLLSLKGVVQESNGKYWKS